MITAVTHVTLLVADQDKAVDFYTKTLDFVVHTDTNFEGMRWLTICTKNNKNFEIALLHASPEAKSLVGKQGGGYPFLSLATDDCHKTYNELKAKGISFESAPTQEQWGISTSFTDVDGNLMYLCQIK